jgi:hypothetical protein
MYYRLWDPTCGRYMATGYNADSLDDLKEQFMSYISPEMDSSIPEDVFSWDVMLLTPAHEFVHRIEGWGLEVEQCDFPFEPAHEYEEEYA